MTDTGQLLSLDEIAVAIDRSAATVRWLRAHGRGTRKFIHRGRIVAYECDVQEWLEKSGIPSRMRGGGR